MRVDHICAQDHFPPLPPPPNYYMQQRNNNSMLQQSKEPNIILTIEAIRRDPKISIQQGAKIYEVLKTTLRVVCCCVEYA